MKIVQILQNRLQSRHLENIQREVRDTLGGVLLRKVDNSTYGRVNSCISRKIFKELEFDTSTIHTVQTML